MRGRRYRDDRPHDAGRGSVMTDSPLPRPGTLAGFPGSMRRPRLLPLLLAFVLAAIVLRLAGHNPLEVYRLLAIESFGATKRIAATLAAATPLIFTGLATAIAFRTGAFNVGVEGCVLSADWRPPMSASPSCRPARLRPFAAGAHRISHRRRGLDAGARPAEIAARRRRGRDDADAQLHCHQPDRISGQRPAAGAGLGQFRDADDRRMRRACRS